MLARQAMQCRSAPANLPGRGKVPHHRGRRSEYYWLSQDQEDLMAIKQLNPYLNFDGTAKKAIALYEKALKAKTEHVQTFGDMPGNKAAPENNDRVLHALVRVGQ